MQLALPSSRPRRVRTGYRHRWRALLPAAGARTRWTRRRTTRTTTRPARTAATARALRIRCGRRSGTTPRTTSRPCTPPGSRVSDDVVASRAARRPVGPRAAGSTPDRGRFSLLQASTASRSSSWSRGRRTSRTASRPPSETWPTPWWTTLTACTRTSPASSPSASSASSEWSRAIQPAIQPCRHPASSATPAHRTDVTGGPRTTSTAR